VRIEDLLYQMHWAEGMRHKEIGVLLGTPRPTVTRWFTQLQVPTQSCHRFTDRNLTSWLYKTGRLTKKPRYEGPDRRTQRTKRNVNVDFFKTWSPEMAYVLGYFAADGGMFINSGGSKYIHFVSADYELLHKVKKVMNSRHKIVLKSKKVKRWKDCYILQIGCKEIYNDLLKRGFTPNKDVCLRFPKIPKEYLRHFIRGFFDGDGYICHGYYQRANRGCKKTFYLQTGFCSGSKGFLKVLSEELTFHALLGSGSIRSKKGRNSNYLSYSWENAVKLFNYMYSDLFSGLCLKRKYNKFVQGIKSHRYKKNFDIRGDVV